MAELTQPAGFHVHGKNLFVVGIEIFADPTLPIRDHGVAGSDRTVENPEGSGRPRGFPDVKLCGLAVVGEPFTVSDLRRVYEVIWGATLDPSNFRRKITQAEGFLEPTGQRRIPATGRPASLYRKGPATLLSPPFLRSPEPS